MRLALVFNPFSYKLHEENLRIVQKYFGLFPPLSMTWVAAIAEREGHDVTLVDARTLGLSRQQTIARLKEFRPDLVGFMMTTYMFRETLSWIEAVKREIRVPVVVGGYNLRIYPKESVTPEAIDFGVVNSALYTVPRLLEELSDGRRFDTVPGLVFKRGGEIIQTESAPLEDFNKYPFPARHLLPNELYAEFPTERRNFTVMVTSKGCPMSCTFCEAGRTPYQPRRPELVVDEIEECYRRFDIREIDIFDYEFLISKKRALAICKGIRDRNLDVIWACRARIDSLDDELLKAMSEAGCRRIYYGIESGDQDVLDRLNKGIKVDQIRATIQATRDAGIKTLGFLLAGVPRETPASFRKMVRFARSLDLDYVQFSKLTAKPGTPYWSKMVDDRGYDYWREYILGNVEEQILDRPWMSMSNNDLDRLTKWAYLRFHLRLGFLFRHTMQVRSYKEFKRKVGAMLDMLFSQERNSNGWRRHRERFRIFNENEPLLKRWWGSARQSLRRSHGC
ncbi:B12-binding domain-containing radical SAM protein [bacterium]|nr:B12-binding domain-containing radical SAM protein [candidate division CSSED10-310 bacterium]